MCKLFSKPKNEVATGDKNNFFMKSAVVTAKQSTFGESKQNLKSRSDEHKGSVRNWDYEKNEIAKYC